MSIERQPGDVPAKLGFVVYVALAPVLQLSCYLDMEFVCIHSGCCRSAILFRNKSGVLCHIRVERAYTTEYPENSTSGSMRR